MASLDRTAYPRFAHTLSDQELDARYGPTEEETTLTLSRSLGASSARLTFLVMLKTRQQLGYFPLLGEVPEQIVGFLRGVLDVPADTGLLDARIKTKTLFRYRDLIRAYLGSRGFGEGGPQLIESVIRSAALTMSDPADLINLAIETLTKANVELPAFSALDRIVGHLRQEVHAALYRSITADLSPELAAALDALLEVGPGETVSPFARFKECASCSRLEREPATSSWRCSCGACARAVMQPKISSERFRNSTSPWRSL